MHAEAHAFIAAAVREYHARGPIYEIGSRNINGSVRPLFADAHYLGIDCADGPGVDVVADGATYTPPMRPQTILCCEVLEHTAAADAIVRQAAAVLAPGGLLLLTTAAEARAPHSAVDGGPLRDGEYYRNLTGTDLEQWTRDAGLEPLRIALGRDGADVYVIARKFGRPAITVPPLRVLVCAPGASWSTADVDAGLHYGLTHHGVQVIDYRLDVRIERAARWLHSSWRRSRRTNQDLEKPTTADIFYQAGVGLLEKALRHQVDVVLVVSAMYLHPDILILLKRAGVRVVVLFTESPYDLEKELAVARLVDGCWTNERSSVDAFRAVNPRSAYLPHGWHPARHRPGLQPGDEAVAAHDVVFVGSAFRERVDWLSAIDWTGIDLGLYGTWDSLGSRHHLRRFVRGAQVTNETTAALYRRAKVGLNLYRTSRGWGKDAQPIAHAESLNPRAYELAACGVCHLSTARAEVPDVFGDRVPMCGTPAETTALLRDYLADAPRRARIAAELPACVAESSWVQRAAQVIGDLTALVQPKAA